jgi:hypothetical protein
MNLLTKSIFRGISNASGQSANNMRRFYKESTFKLNDKPAHPMHKYLVAFRQIRCELGRQGDENTISTHISGSVKSTCVNDIERVQSTGQDHEDD